MCWNVSLRMLLLAVTVRAAVVFDGWLTPSPRASLARNTSRASPRSGKQTKLFEISCFVVLVRLQMFHLNPLTWAFRAAVLNEFQSPEYGCDSSNSSNSCEALGQVEKQSVARFSR